MKELNRLAEEIFNEVLGTDDEVTMEEALEMAKMEMKSKKLTRYEKSDTPRKKSTRERKVDHEKKRILTLLEDAIHNHADTCNDFAGPVTTQGQFRATRQKESL